MTAAGMAAVSQKIKEAAESKGLTAAPQFAKAFDEFDQEGKGFVDENKGIAGLLKQSIGFVVSLTNRRHVVKLFDPDGIGKITKSQFVQFFSPQVSDSRMKKVQEAWNHLNKDNQDKLNSDIIRHNFDKEYIQLQGRKIKVENFANEIVRCFDTDGDGQFDKSDFLLFYKQLSEQISTDEEWNQILDASWSF